MWFSRGRARASVSGLLLFLVMASPAAADKATSQPDQIARHGFADSQVGFVLRDMKTGAVLAAHLADEPFVPASVSKVPTSVAALETLGPEHRFITRLAVTGAVQDGVLRGGVWLQGGGDPLLDNGALKRLAEGLAAAGIRSVQGGFHYDESALPAYSRIDLLQPDAASYNPGISALSLNFNRVELQWRREKGDSFTALIHALSDGIAVPLDSFAFGEASAHLPGGAPFMRGSTVLGLAGSTMSAGSIPPGAGTSDAEEADWVFAPTLPDKGYAWLPVQDAGLTAARVFRGIAETAGVQLPEPQAGVVPADARTIATHESRPLPDIVKLLLKHSNNLTAELLGLGAARAMAGESLPLDQASAEVGRWFAGRLPGAGWGSFAPLNFSGLTSAGRMTPNHVAAILDHGARGTYGSGSLVELMPARSVQVSEQVKVKTKATKKKKAGVRTVTRSKQVGITYAKTGTMAYVRGLAGYLDTNSGRRLIFAIFVNDPEERRALDASPAVHSPVPAPGSRRWLGRARALEQALLRDWAQAH